MNRIDSQDAIYARNVRTLRNIMFCGCAGLLALAIASIGVAIGLFYLGFLGITSLIGALI